MVAGCGANCMKYILFFFNVIFFLAGLALVALGAMIMVTIDQYVSQINTSETLNIDPKTAGTQGAIFFMVIGFVLMGMCFFGCCGAIKEVKCMLGTYAVLVGLVILGELAVVISMFVFRNKFESQFEVARNTLRDNVRKYNGDLGDASTEFVDSVHQRLLCCGADSWEDFKTLSKAWKPASPYQVPISCCQLKDDNAGFDEVNLLYQKCPTNPTILNSYINKPCGSLMTAPSFINLVLIVIVATIFGLMAIELMGLIFAICLIRQIGEPRAVPV